VCGLYDDAVVALNTSVSDPAGARRLGKASIGLSVAGIVISVIIIITWAALIATSPTSPTSPTSSCPYSYNGICYDHKDYVGTYGSCYSGVRSGSYCYY